MLVVVFEADSPAASRFWLPDLEKMLPKNSVSESKDPSSDDINVIRHLGNVGLSSPLPCLGTSEFLVNSFFCVASWGLSSN